MASSLSDNEMLPPLLASTPNTTAAEGTKTPGPDVLTVSTPVLNDTEKKLPSTPSHTEVAMAPSPTSIPTYDHGDKKSPPSVSNDSKNNSTVPDHASSAPPIVFKAVAPTPITATHLLPASTPVPHINPAGHQFRQGIDPVAAHDSRTSGNPAESESHMAMIAGIACGVFILLLVAASFIPWFRQRLRRREGSLGLWDKNGKSDKEFFEELEYEHVQANVGESQWYGVDLQAPPMTALPAPPCQAYTRYNLPARPPIPAELRDQSFGCPPTYGTVGDLRPSARQGHDVLTLDPMTKPVVPVANRSVRHDVNEKGVEQDKKPRSLAARRKKVPAVLSFQNQNNLSYLKSNKELKDESSEDTHILGQPSPTESIPFILNVPRRESTIKRGPEKGFGFLPLGPRVSSVYPHQLWARAFSCENLKEPATVGPLDRSASTSKLPDRPAHKLAEQGDFNGDELP